MRPELLELAARLSAGGERFALVTVVRRDPPSSARVGDSALVSEAGEYHGWAGGGCTRETILRESARAIADGEPRLINLSPDPSGARAGMIALPMACESGGTVEIYIEPQLPPARLAVSGATPVAAALRRIGAAAGYRLEETFSKNVHVVIATMGEDDIDLLEKALAAEPAYIGVIASRKRFEQIGNELSVRGVPRAALERVVAPAGLDIGARNADEIALSVLAQMVQRRTRVAHQEKAEAVDPICGMSVRVALARHRAEVAGRAYYFCCAGCRTKFLEKGVNA
jgi:xanthine dehydrogenase accessory factor